jgi:hypothetical protein
MATNDLGLTPKALQYATERPRLWEHRLFGQVIVDDIERVNNHFQQEQSAQAVGRIVAFSSLTEWISKKNNELIEILDQLTELVNSNHDDAFGLPGMSGNVENLVRYSRKVVSYYHRTVKWIKEVQSTSVAPHFEEIHHELSVLPKGIIDSIENFAPELFKQIDDITKSPPSDKPQVLSLTLKVEISTDRISSALERLTSKMETSGLEPEKFDQFESDFRLKHAVLRDVKYYDRENENTHNATLELFGHCFEAILDNGESIKCVLPPELELKYRISPVEQSQNVLVIIGHPETIFLVSRNNLDILERHYQEINKNGFMSEDDFKNKVISMVSHLLTDKELVAMARNFIDQFPVSYYVDIDYLILIELFIENAYIPIGRSVLLYPKESRDLLLQRSSEFMENNDTSDVVSYGDKLAMFTKILQEKNPDVEFYTTYDFIYNVAIEHFAEEWDGQHKQYFTDINDLSLEEIAERYCSIETIIHQDIAVAGVFII